MTLGLFSTTTFSGYAASTISRKIGAGGISIKYQRASASSTSTDAAISAPALTLDLMPLLRGRIVAGSLRFRLGSYLYVDRAGALYHSINPATGAGTPAGTLNYQTGKATITSWPAGSPTFVLESGLIYPGSPGMASVIGRTAARPLKSQSLSIAATALDGTAIAATAAADGTLSATLVKGTVDAQTGIYKLIFGEVVGGEWVSKLVDPSGLRYNGVAYSYLPQDAELIGIDPVRLPTDGRVPIARAGDYMVLGHTASHTQTVSNGQTINLGRVRLSRVWVIGADKALITSGYSADLDAGTVTFSNVSGYSQPVTIQDRIEDMAVSNDVQINGRVSLTRAITHAYPLGSYLSSALMLGNLKARVSVLFDQQSWGNVWSDAVSGGAAAGTYDKAAHPIEVTNAGAITERWAIVFTNTTAFNVQGEHVGIIAIGNTSTDLAPINPATGEPYFTLRAIGWGNGWAAGNVQRHNTIGAIAGVEIARTVQQGAATIDDDSFSLLIRGDVDKA